MSTFHRFEKSEFFNTYLSFQSSSFNNKKGESEEAPLVTFFRKKISKANSVSIIFDVRFVYLYFLPSTFYLLTELKHFKAFASGQKNSFECFKKMTPRRIVNLLHMVHQCPGNTFFSKSIVYMKIK